MLKNLHPLYVALRAARFASCWQVILSFSLMAGFSASAQLKLVKDINTHVAPSSLYDEDYGGFTDADGTLFFILHGNELWKTSSLGTTAVFLKDFVHIGQLVNVNGTLFFTATTEENGSELWKSDGTTDGTVLVKDIRAGDQDSSPTALVNVNGTLYFSAHDGLRGRELWKSDGTAEGTVLVKDLMQVVGSSNPTGLVNVDGTLFFSANDGQAGYELWKTDGTATGTVLVKDIRPQFKVSSSPKLLTNVDGTLFFTVLDDTGVRRLWKSDGTAAGTQKVSDIPRNPSLLTAVDDVLFFAGFDEAHGTELWKSDGTSAGTELVKDLTPGPGSSTGYATPHLRNFRSIMGKLYFLAVTPGPGIYSATQSLWVSDGTEAGTEELTEYPDIVFSFIDPFLTGYNGYVYFTGTGGDALNLYRTDGTLDGEEIFRENIAAGYTSDSKLTISGSHLYFVSNGQLWKTDGTSTIAVNGIGDSTLGSNPEIITDANGAIYFSANDGTSHGLWKSDGTESGTTLVRYFSDPVRDLTVSGNNLYYVARDNDPEATYNGLKLWRTNLTTGATEQISDINSGDDDYLAELTDVNGTLFFHAELPGYIEQLWKTTGTMASTQLVYAFNEPSIAPTYLTNVNGTLFFSAALDTESYEELWKSDGTEAGTVMVKEINPNPQEPSVPSYLTEVNNTLFFVAYDGTDYEVWKSDGTASGTVKVKDIRTGDAGEFDVNELAAIDGYLYFAAIDTVNANGNYTRAIWRTDGTTAGTVKVHTFAARIDAPYISGIHILGGIDNSVVIALQVGDSNFELWKTDGTATGTEKLADMPYLSAGNDFRDVAVKDGTIYFTAYTIYYPITQLWKTDGTACNTYIIDDTGRPFDLTRSGDNVYLAWTSQRYGRELFYIDEGAIADPCSSMMASAGGGHPEVSIAQDEKTIDSYPNPFMNNFVLHVKGQEGDRYDMQVVNASGAPVSEQRKLEFNRDYPMGSEWSPGMYFVHVKKANRLIVKKIVKTQ